MERSRTVRNGKLSMDTQDERLTVRGAGEYDFPSLQGEPGKDYIVVPLPAALGVNG